MKNPSRSPEEQESGEHLLDAEGGEASQTQLVELPDKTKVLVVVRDRELEKKTDERFALQYPTPSRLRVVGDRSYEVVSVLGKGGMGVVCEAQDLRCERTVAMKLLVRGGEHDEEDHDQFVHEARITSQLEHPNIVPIHELGADEQENDFYTMKLVRGVTLTDVLNGLRDEDPVVEKQYALGHLLTIYQKTCDAVAFAHSRGIVHRDLKPGNVMIGDFGEVLVMDWGLAKRIPEGGARPQKQPSTSISVPVQGPAPMVMEDTVAIAGEAGGDIPTISIRTEAFGAGLKSESGKIVGTPSYMSPEQARGAGGAVDERSDIYSLGAILYSILTLRVPVKGSDIKDVLAKIVAGEITPPLAYNPSTAGVRGAGDRVSLRHCPDGEVPVALSDIAMKALAVDPENRYQSVKELQADIEAYQNGLIWHLVVDEDFSDAGRVLQHWKVVGGQYELKPGELRLYGGEPQMLLLRRDLPGDVRIEFECRQEGTYLNDIGCVMSAVPLEGSWDLSISGYAFKYGAYTNSFNVITRLDRKIFSQEVAPLVAGETYVVRAECVGGRLRMEVNNKEVMSVVDANPLTGAHRTVVGLLGWIADTHYTRIRVYTLGTPWTSDILDIAERHLQKGHCRTAMDLFQEVLDAFPDAERMERAKRGYETASERMTALKNLSMWQEKLEKAWPGVPVGVRLDARGLTVEIRGAGIRDLSPLEGMPLTALFCPVNRITSLEPLRGMPLALLDCGGNEIADLEPLRGMPLNWLNCSVNRITTLEPVRGMPLTTLNCGENKLKDGLEPLRGMPLTWCNCGRCGITNLEPLRGMGIALLLCDGNRIKSLAPLQGMPLTELSCAYNRIESLEPLACMQLNDLNCAGNRIASLDPLRGMPLSTLKCQGNLITTLTPIEGMPFSTLMCGANQLTGVDGFVEGPPKNFLFECDSIPTEKLQALQERWAADPQLADYALRAATLLAVREMDGDKLQGMSKAFEGRRYLFVPKFVTWSEARDLCERFGGHLVTIASEEENGFAASFMPIGGIRCWLGLSTTRGKPEWVTGEPFKFNAFVDQLHAGARGPKVICGGHWFYEPIPETLNPFIIEWGQ